ncbi:MAG: hypothetical protein KAT77_05220 [Nanoarchaeota archaeon]|nr:hypothetical protein [Nanoarchaeota archaeon]
MKVNFFEEFPTRENLEKAKLVKFDSVVYIAARNLKEFLKYFKEIKKINQRITPAYWPVLKKKEGYWLSPFSETKALKMIFEELKKFDKSLVVLLDFEFPIHVPKLFFKNFFRFFKNKKLIKEFLRTKPKKIKLVTAEYVINNKLFNLILGLLGVHLKKGISERIFMCYTSMARNDYWEKVMKNNIEKQKSVGLGVIALGILGDEPIISVQNLEKDLELAKKSRTEKVTIFRLGGLNKDYMKVINNFN